ncbi:MAG: phosphoenolpyruvate carboxykinase (ATP) [Planctomycetota bacterium]|nr:MAG: phosphoenolpyruvate carboxykinase (ATP) [Planctomycetota bacterium]
MADSTGTRLEPIIIPTIEEMTIENFIDTFYKILEWKKFNGWKAYHDNPSKQELLEQAKFYGDDYANGAHGWASNIWSRSKNNTAVVEDNSQLDDQHKLLMRSALEYVLSPNQLIKMDGCYGQNEKVRMHARVYTDAHYPDLPMRWRELVYEADPNGKPDCTLLMLPGLWTPATMPGSGGKHPMFIIRFPEHWFTLGSVSSYQGEWKKSCLTHWIYYCYLKGGTGQHAGTRQFEIQDTGGNWKKIGGVIWGLTGSGKSAHGMYIFDKTNSKFFEDRGLPVLDIVRNQSIKNDDIVGIFEGGAFGSEKGAWTKTEDVKPDQWAIYTAGVSPRAMHENTGKGADGNPNFLDTILQYRGKPNQNARTVMYLDDMKPYFDGSIDIDFPPNLLVFISPGYTCDYAWLKIMDPYFAAATLAAGRTVGHPAQSTEGVGEPKYVPLYSPFIVGKSATNADHTHRFLDILRKYMDAGDCQTLLINTTGRIGTELVEEGGELKPKFRITSEGKKKPVGGTGPSIEETELFLMQAARDAVTWEPHPVWGERVLYPTDVPGFSAERLAELNPFNSRTEEQMRSFLHAQISQTKALFDSRIKGLDEKIYSAMDF